GTLNERQHEYSQGLLEASHHLMELINDVIDLATIEAGHMSLSLSQTNIFALLGSVRDLSRQRAQEADMTLRLDCPEEIGDIHADPRRIKQVMFNLLSNAFKFSQPGDEVIIGANR
ncbi:MAG TPA: sensor histidine kinase, partial [Alphaproteobacteria bacterium]|nr:sensor histidine kinase [Alphaproteobacteria bacterium]